MAGVQNTMPNITTSYGAPTVYEAWFSGHLPYKTTVSPILTTSEVTIIFILQLWILDSERLRKFSKVA